MIIIVVVGVVATMTSQFTKGRNASIAIWYRGLTLTGIERSRSAYVPVYLCACQAGI